MGKIRHQKDTCGHGSGVKYAVNLTTEKQTLLDITEYIPRDAPYGHAGWKLQLKPTDTGARRQATYRHGYKTTQKQIHGNYLTFQRRMGHQDRKYIGPLSVVGRNSA